MKTAIIAFNNLNKSPYVNIYTDFCRANGIEYEVVYPNRDGVQETVDFPLVAFDWDRSKHKMVNFLRFRKLAISYLKETKPDFVIVLTTMPAVLLSGYLGRHYRGRYLVDIRDYTYENVRPYYLLEQYAIKHAAMNVISSPGFRKFLPAAQYSLCQNVSAAYAEGGGAFCCSPENGITIGYVGSIAYKKQCMRLIHLVEQDPRFRFHLYGGEGADSQISDYLAEHPCDRIKAFGPYQPSEKVGIMSKVDILFNAYGFGSKLLDYALSNKLYDSFYMRIPLLTSPNTAMSEEAGAFSFDIDLEHETSLDGLYDWYCAIDGNAFEDYSHNYLQQVFLAQDNFYSQLHKVLIG